MKKWASAENLDFLGATYNGMNSKEVKLDVKIVINRKKTKVLFAEASSDFTDVLLSFVVLPLGTIVNVLNKHYGYEAPIVGSLNTLYNGVAHLDSNLFESEAAKQDLLIPRSCYESEIRELRLNVFNTQPTSSDSGKRYNGVYTESTASFLISDDLKVMPNVANSIMETLSNLGIDVVDMDGSETLDVTFGLNEIMAFLKGSLVYQKPLSALLLHWSPMKLATVQSKQGNTPLYQTDQEDISDNPKKMILKAILQKSNNKLVFAQADHEFINFLFGLLIIPLGRVESYFGSNTGLKCIDNLHKSISMEDYFESTHLKSAATWLINPWLPGSWSLNEFFPLNFDPKQKHCHVKGSRMYMVSDDLTVAPLGLTSTLCVLKGLKISLSDVKELKLQVGLEEGLSIMKAALTSTTALTDGLIKPLLMKQSK